VGDSQIGRAVFLDRDGVINDAIVRDGHPHPPATLAEVRVCTGAPAALAELRSRGFQLFVVTNQPDVARGTAKAADVDAFHSYLSAALPIDKFYTCMHDDADGCVCRKPLPGLITRAASEHSIDLATSYLIGDRWRDIAAGVAAGVTTIFIDRNYAERKPEPSADGSAVDIEGAVNWILNRELMLVGDSRSEGPDLSALRTKIFADGADVAGLKALAAHDGISGFTTNPTLMRKAGIIDYRSFALEALQIVGTRPISFEVFADDENEMERQARIIAAWGSNIYVKIPVTNTKGQSTGKLVRRLTDAGIKLNVTALMTVSQVHDVTNALSGGAPAYISVFAGRIADTGRDPLPIMRDALEVIRPEPQIELIWASPRELLNIFHADAIGCQIITVTNDILAKLGGIGKDLDEYSLDTVKMFHRDASEAAFSL
jgi:transaldolase